MNKAILFSAIAAAVAGVAGAQTFTEWQNPELNQVNRQPMHAAYFPFESAEAAAKGVKEDSPNFLSLNGTWKFNWVNDLDQRPVDFYTTSFNDKGWDTMQVPAVWELNGYGDPIYVNTGYAWRNDYESNPPLVPTKNNHVGSYRQTFTIPAEWTGKDVIAHFGSVTSNIYLWVNGKFVGYGLSLDIAPLVNDVKALEGRKVVFAFRPEAIKLEKSAGDYAIDSKVELTELLGDTTNVYATVGEGDDKVNIILKVNPHKAPAMGADFTFRIPKVAAYIYDAETEEIVENSIKRH